MDCPKCSGGILLEKNIKTTSMSLDRCNKCAGLWFDAGELPKLLGKALPSFQVPSYATKNDNCRCPGCKNALFEFCIPSTITLIDACKSCNGVWLDPKEWKEIKTALSAKEKMTCPKCSVRQTQADSCSSCGVIIAKYNQTTTAIQENNKAEKAHRKQNKNRRSYADNIPGVKGALLRFIDGSIDQLTRF